MFPVDMWTELRHTRVVVVIADDVILPSDVSVTDRSTKTDRHQQKQ